MQIPRVSVLIPVYKPAYLAQAIASVLAQTFDDYELLISDDSPAGAAAEVIGSFGDPRIRVLSGPKQGLVPNSAFLWTQARGEYVKFVYDDDFLLPWAIQRSVEIMDEAPDASFAYVQRHIVLPDGAIKASEPTLTPGGPRLLQARQVVDGLIAHVENVIGEPICVLFRRSLLKDADFLRTYAGYPIRHLIDVASYFNALRLGPCVGVPEFHAAFRQHAAQTSSPDNPAIALAVFEWEIFLRGELERGQVSQGSALAAVDKLQRLYGKHGPNLPELQQFKVGLPKLRQAIAQGGTRFLDEEFQAAWRRANAVISERVSRTAWVNPMTDDPEVRRSPMEPAIPVPDPEVLGWTPLSASRLLEIGCGEGEFAAEYKRRNPLADYTATGTDEAAAAVAQTRVDRLLRGEFEALDDRELARGGPFDVVVLNGGLGRMRDPVGALARLRTLLGPGGVLVCSLPNAAHWTALAELIQGRWPPRRGPLFEGAQHFFTLEALHAALRQAGFTPLKSKLVKSPAGDEAARRVLPALAGAAEFLGLQREAFLRSAGTAHHVVVAEPAHPESRGAAGVAKVVFSAMAPRFLEARAHLPAQQLNSLADLSIEFQQREFRADAGAPWAPQIAILQRVRVVDRAKYMASIARLVAKDWLMVADLDDHPALLAAVQGTKESEKWLPLTAAHAVQTSTPALAEAIRAHNPEVALFPNAVFDLPPFAAREGEAPRVFYGALNREGYSAQVAEALRPCLEARPETEFLVVSDRAFFDALPTERKTFRPSLPYDQYLDVMGGCHILLSPLEGTFGESFKSDIKFLEASARSLATIASPVVYGETVVRGETGLLALSLEDWPAALGRLLDEPGLRTTLARKAWDYVRRERMFAYQTQARRDWLFSLWERRASLTAALFERRPELARGRPGAGGS